MIIKKLLKELKDQIAKLKVCSLKPIVQIENVVTLFLTCVCLFAVSCQSAKKQSQGPIVGHGSSTAQPINTKDDPGLIAKVRQLTFVGPRAGEGYFSADGKKLIFQSERDEKNPFYQIYLLDLETGKTQRMSTGKGKTTCSWVHPNLKQVMFASTHLDPTFDSKVKLEAEERKSPQRKKYAWDYDENFDIFSYDLASKKYQRLTTEKGYDAEGAYSPDGKQIVFASNRRGFSEKLSAEDQKAFEADPSLLMDIYIMNSDGTQVRQLTDVKGYDGGPFFSANGKKITWRRFVPSGQSAEVMTMNLDGSDQKQLTRLGSMSWAPFFHPSGDYLIFTTNKHGYTNFELFIVDAEGKKDPVRVSYWDGFDGLPVFSPDGNKLAWTHRNEKGESQIYMSEWNDQGARRLLSLPEKPVSMPKMTYEIKQNEIQAWVQFLASEKFKGRKTGSPEEIIYSQQLALYFKQIGLSPGAGESYLQKFDFTSGVNLGSNNHFQLKIGGKDFALKINEDFIPLSFSKSGEFSEAPLVFAGYGIVAPANEKTPAYDSYKDLDVSGKWAVVFRDIPENISNEKRLHLNLYSRLHHKALVAKQRGAIGLILVAGPNSSVKQKLVRFRYDGSFSEAGIPMLSISDKVAEQILDTGTLKLKNVQTELDEGHLPKFSLGSVLASAKVDLSPTKSEGLNVVGLLKVAGASKTVMIGAHGDHLGMGDVGSSLATAKEQGGLHFGADDNASGMAGVLELAHFFIDYNRRHPGALKQNLAFAVWSGEEIGLIGSSHFVKESKLSISSYLNMDMIGRLRDHLLVQGVGSAKEWKPLFEEMNLMGNFAPVSLSDDPYLPTDSMAFYLKNIPAISFFTGSHSEYHTPRDIPELINYNGIEQTLNVVKGLTTKLAATSHSQVNYVKVESSKSGLEGRSFRIFLGTIPDYSQDGIKGVKISGTTKDSPAEKAGLIAGDVIVELAGTKIDNLYDYTYCLQAIKANSETTIKISRNGKMEELKIVPKLKE